MIRLFDKLMRHPLKVVLGSTGLLLLDEHGASLQVTAAHWRSLLFFSLYRLCAVLMLAFSAYLQMGGRSFATIAEWSAAEWAMVTYVISAFICIALVLGVRKNFHGQLTAMVVVDILFLSLIVHVGDGLRANVGVMLLVSLAAASLVGRGRMVLFYAALATITILADQTYQMSVDRADVTDLLHAGIFGFGFFAVAISSRFLALRVIANERLARERGVLLQNQTLVGQRAIEEMQDGVLVIDRMGMIQQHNPKAERLLGLGSPDGKALVDYSSELSIGLKEWRERPNDMPVLVRAPASGAQLWARFIQTESTDNEVLVFLEDVSRMQEQARQIKLAALGRLTASIAHEIRNPLSAIRHAGELVSEDLNSQIHTRLIQIILDNTLRVERIVSDVLELGRRDRVFPEQIWVARTITSLVQEFLQKEGIPEPTVCLDLSENAVVFFDKSHFFQIWTNLLANALRYSRQSVASVVITARTVDNGSRVEICIEDDGDGIATENIERVFEPFFTTHSKGTGLGLYIARELCEANNAQLMLKNGERGGAHFCLKGRVDAWQ